MRLAAIFAALAALVSPPAVAQTANYPSQPIKLIVPFAAGGVTDLVGRLAGEHIKNKTGQPVIVENRPGASGNTGMHAVVTSAPDGYTIGLVSINTWAVNPLMFKSMPYDPHKELVAVAAIAEAPQILVVHSSVPARTLPEFIAYAKANPGKVNHGTAGLGTSNHLGADAVFRQTGVDIPHVHYRGGGPAVTDLVVGSVQVACVAVGLVIGHVQAGTLRPIAAVAPKRLPFLPDLATTAEAGLPSYETSNWFGIAAPAKTPKDVVEALNKLLVSMADDAAIQKRVAASYMLPMRLTPAELAASITADTPKWAGIVRNAGIKPE